MLLTCFSRFRSLPKRFYPFSFVYIHLLHLLTSPAHSFSNLDKPLVFLPLQMFESREHHVRADVCLTRPPYRDGKKPRAVKVYTVAQESKYLLVQNIPSIAGVADQLLPHFNHYGPVEQSWRLDGYVRKDLTEEDDRFLDTMLIKFARIQHARTAKCRLDDLNFMGSSLHVCYAPECETVEDLREKINERRSVVEHKAELNRRTQERARSAGRISAAPAPRTMSEIRTQMREIVQRSNLVPLVLQQELKPKRRRVQL